jgi:ARG and Rhodanese-Phosphatase-superfamily-associated Protein domain
MTPAQIVHATLDAVQFGLLLEHENLAVLPLLARDPCEPDYLTLDDALAQGTIQITEVGEAGTVPELRALNSGSTPVLLTDGEELVGAKQNRVLNLTILVPPQRSIVIPVSCVEAGRWHHRTRAFTASTRVQFAEGRAAKMRNVTESLQREGRRRSDQGAVWDLIAQKSGRLRAPSATGAMGAMFESRQDTIEQYVRAFPPVERQVGAVVFVSGQLAGLEVFDAPETWRKLSPKVLRSYALDAIDRRRTRRGKPRVGDASVFSDRVTSSAAFTFAAAGEGEDVRLTSAGVAGAALVARGRTIHLSAFPVNGQTVDEAAH